jgi:hypothetical protein
MPHPNPIGVETMKLSRLQKILDELNEEFDAAVEASEGALKYDHIAICLHDAMNCVQDAIQEVQS